MADEIPDPITSLAAMAVQHHEAFTAWVNAGFTEKQALELLKAVFLGTAAGGEE
ncbi:hypothetical protein [Streptomyces sp. NPDC001089]